MERSFAKEIELLRLKQGEVFTGEGILAVTKALLQSGVSYVGGYQGAPVSHLLDVLVQAKELMSELGINVEANSSEASAAATEPWQGANRASHRRFPAGGKTCASAVA